MKDSQTSKHLFDELGFEKGESVMTINEPARYREFILNHGLRDARSLPAEWVHIFVESAPELHQLLASLNLSEVERGIWVSWPIAPGANSEIMTESVRAAISSLGWVETKNTTILKQWTGIKFLKDKSLDNYPEPQ